LEDGEGLEGCEVVKGFEIAGELLSPRELLLDRTFGVWLR
jgi:hypothetical protein